MAPTILFTLISFILAVAAFAEVNEGRKVERNLRIHTGEAAGDVSGVVSHSAHKKKRRSLIVQPAQVEQKLIICNAYASDRPMDIVQVRTKAKLTGETPLVYKQCRDFSVPLDEGDQLDFKAGALDVGTFYATGLPKFQSSLLLIPHRRTPQSVGVSFESHAFAELTTPQIAVIDAFRGQDAQQSSVKIIQNEELMTPVGSGEKGSAAAVQEAEVEEPIEEDLKFNSVVAVNPGKYAVTLRGLDGQNVTHQIALNAVGTSKYVVMRIGASESKEISGPYPEELIVFPREESGAMKAFQLGILSVAIMLVHVAFPCQQ